MTRTFLLLTLPLLLACGSTAADDTTTEEGTDVVGEGGETTELADDPMADPCAEGQGEPCEEGLAGTRGAITEADAGVGDAGPEETVEGADPTEEDPQVVWRNQVRAGRMVFDRVCGVCHPEGEEDIGPDIRRKWLTVARMRRMIRNGQGRMRPIPARRLPEARMDDLMAYLSTMGTVRGVRRPE